MEAWEKQRVADAKTSNVPYTRKLSLHVTTSLKTLKEPVVAVNADKEETRALKTQPTYHQTVDEETFLLLKYERIDHCLTDTFNRLGATLTTLRPTLRTDLEVILNETLTKESFFTGAENDLISRCVEILLRLDPENEKELDRILFFAEILANGNKEYEEFFRLIGRILFLDAMGQGRASVVKHIDYILDFMASKKNSLGL